MTRQYSVRQDLTLLRIGSKQFSSGLLKAMLPDVETALFFAKAYKFDFAETSSLLDQLFHSNLIDELFHGTHSETLQSFLVDIAKDVPQHLMPEDTSIKVDPDKVPKGEILPHVWAAAEVEIAKSIQHVADKLFDTLDRMPSKQGQMLFQHMRKLNANHPKMGVYAASIHHPPVPDSLVILDVSGSMSSTTVQALAEDVVALAYKANAHMAIVSSNAFYWEPGTYTVQDILSHAEYGGTCYDQLAPLFKKDWGTVITIADYDSAWASFDALSKTATGRVGTVFDISLVNRPTFLAECVGQLADEVRPLLIANSSSVLR